MNTEKFNLKKNSFQINACSILNKLRDESDFTNITLASEDNY